MTTLPRKSGQIIARQPVLPGRPIPRPKDGPSLEGEDTDKAGRAPRLALRTDPNKAGDASKAYPAGKRLSPAEVKRSIQHAPQCPKTKKPICWDAACHVGCHRGACPNAHEPLPKLSKLDYTVAMQVLRRGGLRNGAEGKPPEGRWKSRAA